MSPTAPTFATLNDELNKAHRRIRELQAREAALLAQNRTLCTAITECIYEDHPRTAAELTSSPNDGSDDRFGIGDQVGSHTSQRLSPAERPPAPRSSPDLARARPASKRESSHMFDLGPIAAVFLIIAVMWLIAAVACGRDDR